MLVLISGVSGSGKDTIIDKLIERDLKIKKFPSYTTREKRMHEVDGEKYFFVSEDKFKQMIENDCFYEYSITHDHYYGTAKHVIEESLKKKENLIRDVDVNGAMAFKKLLNKEDLLTIFLDIPKEEMEKRLRERGDLRDEHDLKRRLERYDYEESFVKEYDYVILNMCLDESVEKIYNILKEELNGY